jgi:predicted transcriptional regulator
VEKGLAAADPGECTEPEELGKLIDRRYPG